MGSLTRPGILSWAISIPRLVNKHMVKMFLEDFLAKFFDKKMAIGTKRNRLRNLSNAPDIWMKPNMPFELGFAGVNTPKARVTK